MRRTIGKTITNPNNFHIPNVTKQIPLFIHSSSPFSSSSGSGAGRGRGRGGGGGGVGSSYQFVVTKNQGKPDSDETKPESPESRPSGLGHGRGRPIAADPNLPSFSSFASSIKPAQTGTGRGRVTTESVSSQPATESRSGLPPPKTPIFVKIEELKDAPESATELSRESNLPTGILSALSGAGRGKPTKQPGPTPQIKEENRHARSRRRAGPGEGTGSVAGPAQPKVSREEAVKNARRILSRGEEGEGSGGRGRGRGGRGRWRGGRGLQRGERRGRGKDSEDSYAAGLYLGDNADGEKLAQRLGVENMNKLVEGFEEMTGYVLPSPMDDVYLDALHTNYLVRVL